MAPSVHTTSRHAPFVRRVAESIKRQRLIERGDRIVVAVSGGPDSVALLSVLHSLASSCNLSLWVAHFNYGLRGRESDDDAAFVRRLSERYSIPHTCERLVLAEDVCKGRSLQEAAREARYAALTRVRASFGADKVALGHTRDDQAETVIMWLLRGAGSTGLSGMPCLRLPFIRPLLTVGRMDVLSYLSEQGLDFREDSSNAKSIYLRNRVRHDVLPLLKQFNPAILDGLTRQADILREDNRCLDDIAEEQCARIAREEKDHGWVVERTDLLALHLGVQRRVLRKVIQRTAHVNRGPSFASVSLLLERVVHGDSGSSAIFQHVNVSREYDRILIQRRGNMAAETLGPSPASIALPVPFRLSWPLTGQRLQADLVHCSQSDERGLKLSPMQAMLDADCLTLNLQVRAWKPGDRFYPFGFKGHQKKLQDFFADLKVPRSVRGRIPLVVAPEGIVWVAGYRMDHRFRVTEATRRVLRLALSDAAGRELQ